MQANLDSEIGYLFTNDEAYLKTRTRLIPVKDKKGPQQAQQGQQGQQNHQGQQGQQQGQAGQGQQPTQPQPGP